MPFVNGVWQPDSSTTASRVADISSQDSPMMRQAAASGLKAAGSRGLVNSSMGIGAAQGAVLGAAAPIASQDSQQAHGNDLQMMQDEAKAKEVAATTSIQAANTYTQGIGQTLVNDKIPASARSQAQADMANLYRNTVAKVSALYPNVQLSW